MKEISLEIDEKASLNTEAETDTKPDVETKDGLENLEIYYDTSTDENDAKSEPKCCQDNKAAESAPDVIELALELDEAAFESALMELASEIDEKAGCRDSKAVESAPDVVELAHELDKKATCQDSKEVESAPDVIKLANELDEKEALNADTETDTKPEVETEDELENLEINSIYVDDNDGKSEPKCCLGSKATGDGGCVIM